MPIKDLVMKNRSYRNFDASFKINRSVLEDFVDNARYAPSSVNLQPLKYFISDTDEMNNKIFPLTGWAKKLDITLPYKGNEPTAYIVICLDKKISESEITFKRDVGIVAQTIMLSAAEKDINGCMIGNFNPQKISEALELDESLAPMLILAFGKAAEEVVVEDIVDNKSDYYRDEKDVHHVPKRPLEEILIN